jgi:hypothetical protein
MNYEFETNWKEAIEDQFKVLTQDLRGQTEEKHKQLLRKADSSTSLMKWYCIVSSVVRNLKFLL